MSVISTDVNSVQAWACTLWMSPAGQMRPRLPSHVLKSQLAAQSTARRCGWTAIQAGTLMVCSFTAFAPAQLPNKPPLGWPILSGCQHSKKASAERTGTSFPSHAVLCGDSQRDSPGDSKATQSLCCQGTQQLLAVYGAVSP